MQIKALDKSNNPLLTKRRQKIEAMMMNKWDNEEGAQKEKKKRKLN